MHGIRRLSCQKSKRIPLVAARCVLLESAAESASQGGIFRCSAFIFADKNSIVVIGTLIERAVCNTLLYKMIVSTSAPCVVSVCMRTTAKNEMSYQALNLVSQIRLLGVSP